MVFCHIQGSQIAPLPLRCFEHRAIDNCVGTDGALALAEAMKVNSGLRRLFLRCVPQHSPRLIWQKKLVKLMFLRIFGRLPQIFSVENICSWIGGNFLDSSRPEQPSLLDLPPRTSHPAGPPQGRSILVPPSGWQAWTGVSSLAADVFSYYSV